MALGDSRSEPDFALLIFGCGNDDCLPLMLATNITYSVDDAEVTTVRNRVINEFLDRRP